MEKSFGGHAAAAAEQDRGAEPARRHLADRSRGGTRGEPVPAAAEVRKDFYAELPIRIRLTGDYHEMGNFASGIAALPRIVTLHDIEITQPGPRSASGRRGDLVLNVTAKTYRYLDEDEVASQEQAKSAASKKKKKTK
jgi:type IV pilus assembly protein PilO